MHHPTVAFSRQYCWCCRHTSTCFPIPYRGGLQRRSRCRRSCCRGMEQPPRVGRFPTGNRRRAPPLHWPEDEAAGRRAPRNDGRAYPRRLKCICSPGGDGWLCWRTDRSGGAGGRGRGLRVGRVDYESRQVPPSRETVRYAVGKRAQLPGAKRAVPSSAGVRAHSSATCNGGGVWVAYPCVLRPASLRAVVTRSQPLTCASHQALLPVPARKLRTVGNGYRWRVRTLQTATRSLHSHLAASPVAWLSLPRAHSPHS